MDNLFIQQSLEVLCECGVTLSKNFERLLSQHTGGGSNIAGASSSSGTLDGDMLSQSVATWELAHKVATADTNSLISELLPLLQETVQGVMKDPNTIQSSSTYDVCTKKKTILPKDNFTGVIINFIYFRSFDLVSLPFFKSNGGSVNSTCHVHPPRLVLMEVRYEVPTRTWLGPQRLHHSPRPLCLLTAERVQKAV